MPGLAGAARWSRDRAAEDNYDALRIELEDSIATNLEAMGSMASKAVEKKLQSTRDEVNIFKASVYDKQKSLGDSMLAGKIRRSLSLESTVVLVIVITLRASGGPGQAQHRAAEPGTDAALYAESQGEGTWMLRKSIFAKFDLDRDGKLNKKEVEAYMKATINFDLPQAVLEQIATSNGQSKLAEARERLQGLEAGLAVAVLKKWCFLLF
eukprot:Skav220156  [mRNA]  locus=scaffold564:103931:116760:+ [translate_table: standard]